MLRSSTNTTITFKELANVVLTIVKMINVYYAFICFCFCTWCIIILQKVKENDIYEKKFRK